MKARQTQRQTSTVQLSMNPRDLPTVTGSVAMSDTDLDAQYDAPPACSGPSVPVNFKRVHEKQLGDLVDRLMTELLDCSEPGTLAWTDGELDRLAHVVGLDDDVIEKTKYFAPVHTPLLVRLRSCPPLNPSGW